MCGGMMYRRCLASCYVALSYQHVQGDGVQHVAVFGANVGITAEDATNPATGRCEC